MFNVGDRVRKNSATWQRQDFDPAGRGDGIGVVLEPPFLLQDTSVAVAWPECRSLELVTGLLPAEREYD